MRRTLTHFWRMNLAVIAGTAVAAAVLTGALVVGDSVRGSLRDITLERLGSIDHALAGQRFFDQSLAERLAADSERPDSVAAIVPTILLQGSAEHADSGARATDVGLQGIGTSFLELFPDSSAPLAAMLQAEGPRVFPPAAISRSLANELGAEVGDAILVSLKRWSAVPRGSLLGRKDTTSVVERVRLTVHTILEDRGVGAFGLTAHQTLPTNIFVPIEDLQKALDQRGTINSLLVASKNGQDTPEDAVLLDKRLETLLEIDDLGLSTSVLGEEPRTVLLESSELILKPSLAHSAKAWADEQNAVTLPILTYLANTIRVGDLEVPYSTVTSIDLDPASELPARFGELRLVDGTLAPRLEGEDILLNAWTAEELEAKIGDAVELTYFAVGPREELYETQHTFRLRGIVAVDGLAADRRLAQEVPGIADSDNMADWDPPFPLDLGRIRSADEEYWDLYRATPRAFVALETGQQLWRSRWGDRTSLRLAALDATPPELLAKNLSQNLPRRVDPSTFGLTFQPVKYYGLQAATGATDFSGLFIGFSQFLIVSAALLAFLLFSLGVEQRSQEIGLRLATGFPPRQVRRMLLSEGVLLAVLGSLVGLLGAVGYGWLLMLGLRTWWRDAVGTSRLELHVEPTTLTIGFILSVLIVLFAIWRAVRRVGRLSAVALLAKNIDPPTTRPGHLARRLAIGSAVIAGALLVYMFASGQTQNPGLFFVVGPCVLIGLLALFALRLARPHTSPASEMRYLPFIVSQCGRNRGRSLLSTTLVAVASFMIVTVAAFHLDYRRLDLGKDSGTGGFSLVAESEIEIHHNLNSKDGRLELGLGDEATALLERTEVLPFKLRPGDDTSCLNLYQPREPRLLGVPDALLERGGFTFQQTLNEVDDPWAFLAEDYEPGVIPAIGDANSTQWILKLKLGEDLELLNELGQPIRLRLVANLATSVFQSELLIPESAFLEHFPSYSGASYFLLDAPTEEARKTAQVLENDLSSYGFDAQLSGDKLAAFHAVQNTYLSTFQTLGGLGLLLGTLGLAIILIRNVLERRGELAALQAFGFRRSRLTRMIIAENTILLLVGLTIGTLSALLAVAPHLLKAASGIPWPTLGATLGAILLFGLASSALAAFSVMRSPLLPALKSE